MGYCINCIFYRESYGYCGKNGFSMPIDGICNNFVSNGLNKSWTDTKIH